MKLLERSVEELESTICALENKVSDGISSILVLIIHYFFSIINLVISPKVEIINKDAERQQLQRADLEVELEKVRQQMLAVPPSGISRNTVEDEVADLAFSSRSAWL